MTTVIIHDWPNLECDVCVRKTRRLHQCWAVGGTETWACDTCAGYDAEAYDDVLEEVPEPRS